MPLRLIALFFLIFTGASQAAELTPFKATYSAKYSGLGVTAVRELTGKGDQWRLRFDVESMFADIREFSRFNIDGRQVTPLHYEYHKTGLGRDKHTVLRFEPEQHRVINVRNSRRSLENAPRDIQDKITYQLQLALDVAAGKKELKYVVTDGKKLREYEFAVAGTETLQTPLGEIETVKVQRVRDSGSDRETNIWFAPAWNYALVKLMQDEDGKTYQIALTELIIDGKSVNAVQ